MDRGKSDGNKPKLHAGAQTKKYQKLSDGHKNDLKPYLEYGVVQIRF
jgi:hypothetical protein